MSDPASKIDFTTPQSARIWNYFMGGKDYYEVDRIAGDAYIASFPAIVEVAKQARQFLIRAVTYLAREAGMRQFLDIGTGLPTMQNTHEVAQSVAPDSKIVYVDNDPVVLAHARALLVNTTDEGVTTYIDADVHRPEQILADAHNVLNFTQPIAVMFMGILAHVADYDEVRSIVSRVMAAVPSGSHLLLWDGTISEASREANQAYRDTGAVAYNLRTPEQIALLFGGLELVDPGVVQISQWRPDPADPAPPLNGYGGIGRKP